jgi:hypothetical protein
MVLRNQTVEDASPLISWIPVEQWIDGGAADSERPNYSDGSFRLTTTRGAFASFTVSVIPCLYMRQVDEKSTQFNGTGVW